MNQYDRIISVVNDSELPSPRKLVQSNPFYDRLLEQWYSIPVGKSLCIQCIDDKEVVRISQALRKRREVHDLPHMRINCRGKKVFVGKLPPRVVDQVIR